MADASKQLKEMKCQRCGKPFIYRDHYAYKVKMDGHVKVLCSWTCYRAMLAEKLKSKE